jgi:uncharacterized protein YbjT (DUF2867 family)
MSASGNKSILVLGGSGLIGHFVASDLSRRGFAVTAAARRFTAAQRDNFGTQGREIPIAGLSVAELARLLRESEADVVVNCLGVLQDGPEDRTQAVHETFVQTLLDAMRVCGRPVVLVHVSIPGSDHDDRTAFSRTKRNAERLIAASGLSYAILRPGFVWAPAAYGGSALLRTLAASPAALPASDSSRPFFAVAIEDVAGTVAWLAQNSASGVAVSWDVMEPQRRTVGDVVGSLRRWLGSNPHPRVATPGVLLNLAAKAGDLAAWLGWKPPVRSTALEEMRRGVEGDPRPWMAATGIVPRSLEDALRERPATVQDQWFARLYGFKPLVIASLVAFWCVSGLIALTVAYESAVAILTSHGLAQSTARAVTVASSLLDISVGLAIAVRRTCRVGLMAGVAVSIGYMASAAVVTPDLWVEPLGALVKTGPAIVLMLVALATLKDR